MTHLYKVVRKEGKYPAADTFIVVYVPTRANISQHESEAKARAAMLRYKAADFRRSERGFLAGSSA